MKRTITKKKTRMIIIVLIGIIILSIINRQEAYTWPKTAKEKEKSYIKIEIKSNIPNYRNGCYGKRMKGVNETNGRPIMEKSKSREYTILFAILFGFIGLDKLYLENTQEAYFKGIFGLFFTMLYIALMITLVVKLYYQKQVCSISAAYILFAIIIAVLSVIFIMQSDLWALYNHAQLDDAQCMLG